MHATINTDCIDLSANIDDEEPALLPPRPLLPRDDTAPGIPRSHDLDITSGLDDFNGYDEYDILPSASTVAQPHVKENISPLDVCAILYQLILLIYFII